MKGPDQLHVLEVYRKLEWRAYIASFMPPQCADQFMQIPPVIRDEGFVDELAELSRSHERIPSGCSKFCFRTGATYVGSWRTNNARHGFGRQTWTDGAQYEGQWEDDSPSSFSHSDGDVFIGQWDKNMASGVGTYHHQGATSYKGEWRRDLQDGHGVETWAEGPRYNTSFGRGALSRWAA
ncbi:unnamed protein product [Prorocentrum cordatum]|uniref:MORN repeat-containing protein 5 n=1 Tax=Prorocentrum cordatum TaxID=2364126 RepID=A0ABN9UFW7_9DINO|nr:unnamed protein product [Polarella glacialis]